MRLGGILSTAVQRPLRPIFAMLLCLASAVAHAQDAGGATQISYEGTLGPARIGLTVIVKNGAVSGGHYFYAKSSPTFRSTARSSPVR